MAVIAGCLLGCGGGGGSTGGGGAGSPSAGHSGGVGAAGSPGSGGGTAGGGGAGKGGASGAGGTGGMVTDDLGKACQADTDCGGGLICLKATDKVIFGQGGPPNGYCTSACVSGDGKCQTIGGVCLDMQQTTGGPAESYCVRSCTFGSNDRASKCHGRNDVGCRVTDSATNAAACIPLCSQDSQCPAGRKCDLSLVSAVCVDTPVAGDPLGAHCSTDPDAGANNCAGVCLTLGTLATFCSARCVLGAPDLCNSVGQGTSPAGGGHGLCDLASTGATPGDVGYCAQQCDTEGDCADKTDPGGICDLTVTAGTAFSAHGLCSFTGFGSHDGGADGSIAEGGSN